jgi:biopolymer transport protein ExbB
MATSFGGLFIQGGWVMWPLLIFSIITWAIAFERAYFFFSIKPKVTRLAESLIQSLRSGDSSAAKQICHSQKPFIAELFLSALDTRRSKEAAGRLTERNRVRMAGLFKRNLWILGTIGSASPFIGLLGTVIGIVKAFHEMAEKGTGGFAVVAAGISEALIATAFGLVVAILSLVLYNVFTSLTNQTVTSLKVVLEEILDQAFEKNSTSA